MQRLLSVFCVVIFLLAARISIAQEPKEEIRKLFTEIEEKFNQGDAKALAACWTPGGDFGNHMGDRFEGRENIEKAFQESFSAHKKSSLQIHVLSLRIVSDGLAIADVIPEVKPQTTTLAGEPNLNLVLVKRDGRWLVEKHREIHSVPSPGTASERLRVDSGRLG